MTAVYPGTVATIAANKQDDVDIVTGVDAGTTTNVGDHAAHHNQLAEEIVAVQTELGTDPSGSASTVRERLESRDFKQSCIAASARGTNVSLSSPGATLDGVTLTNPSRIFLKDQTAPAENGIWVWTGSAVALTRDADADTAVKLSDSMIVTVEQGTQNQDTIWELTSNNPITVGTTALRFTRISPPYQDQNYASPWAVNGGAQQVFLENIGRAGLVNTAMLTSGQIQCLGVVVLPAGRACTGMSIWCGSTAGASLTHSWFGLQSVLSGNIVAVTTDDTGASLSAGARRRIAFSSALTPDIDLPVRGFAMFAGTTIPSVMGVQGISGTPGIQNAAPQITGRDSTTGRTTPLSVGTAVSFATADHRTGWFGID